MFMRFHEIVWNSHNFHWDYEFAECKQNSHFSLEMGPLRPRMSKTFTMVTFWKPLWGPPHPKKQEITKSAEFHDFHDFLEFQRVFTENRAFCENAALAAGRPSETTNKQQVIHGFERRARRGRRFRAKSGNIEFS